jgi:hypothetical protein
MFDFEDVGHIDSHDWAAIDSLLVKMGAKKTCIDELFEALPMPRSGYAGMARKIVRLRKSNARVEVA